MSVASGYERLLAVVRAAKVALRRSELIAGTGRVVLVAGLAFLTLLSLDNLFRPGAAFRIALLLAALGVTGYAIARELVLRIRRPLTDDAVAVRIEQAAGTRDNGIINALQLGRDARHEAGLSGAIVRSVVERGAAVASRIEPGRVVDRPRVLRSILLGAGGALVVVLYAVLLPRYFENAVRRYTNPAAFVPPVSGTILEVSPGDAAVIRGEPLTVSMTARGDLPSSARILAGTGGEFEAREMLFDGRAFSFTFEAVAAPFDYRVEAGDASSAVYQVSVVDPPEVRRLDLTYRYPAYLGLPDRHEESADGEIRAPRGTTVTVVAWLSEEVFEAALDLGGAGPRTMASAGEKRVRGTITVDRSGTWAILLQTRHAVQNRDPVRHRIVALPDEPPRVAVTAPGKDVTVTLPARIPITVTARDDYGLTRIAILTRREDGGEEKEIARFDLNGERERIVASALVLDEGDLLPGDVLTYHAVARDAHPSGDHVGRSRTFSIRVRSRSDRAAEAEALLADLAAKLRDLLEREEGVLRDTESLRTAASQRQIERSGIAPRADALARSQSRIGGDMAAVANLIPGEVRALAEVRGTLLELARNEVVSAVRHLKDSRNRADLLEVGDDLLAAVTAERVIVAKLSELLGAVEAMARKAAENPEEWFDEKMDEGDPQAAMEEALTKLRKFLREQEEILRQSRRLEEKDVDDFTEEDLRLLEKLAASESELARFLEDLKDDLSKLPEQDFANSTVLKELIEAVSEVELAAGALKMKNLELAVPTEQSALELAESLEENIEKWLEDVPDRIKWNMEEFEGELPEVPMAELPDQLEDLIGELIEEEEDLMDEMEDVTSGWADSIDKGAGWGVSDGPISNMSAQGKTGNTLPNKNEIGGRSGEGRTGRSHGEMVEEEATGKGGRRTPTRLTPDPYEGKAVKDRSKDPVGGATGGGKLAGGAGEGLRGPLPPEVKGELGRLAGKQVGIRQKAETLDRALRKLKYPGDPVARSVVLMRQMEEALAKGDLAGFARRHALLIRQMEEGRELLKEHARVVKDRSRAVPKEILEEVESIDLSDLPEGYRRYLREYYKILSRGGAK